MTKEILEEEFSVVEDKKFESDIDVERKIVKVKDVHKGFVDTEETGTWGYDGKLNVRPAFQREFVYEGDDLPAVIESVLRGFPLSLIYWGETEDKTLEMVDGQQRTLSIMKFIENEFTIDIDGSPYLFKNLDKDLQEKILNYNLEVAILRGTTRAKLKYFQLINTHGLVLNNQELLNAAHTGKFVTGARKAFANKNSEFFNTTGLGGNWSSFLKKKGVDIKRQHVLEKVLLWVCGGKKSEIANYLAENRDNDASILIDEVLKILTWAKGTFAPTSEDYEDWMVDVDWGEAYYTNEKVAKNKLTPKKASEVTKEIKRLQDDDEVKKFTGIPMYLITKKEKYLNLRIFDTSDKRRKWNEQGRKCNICEKDIAIDKAHADHVQAWVDGGKTEYGNLQVLCIDCNLQKSNK